MGSKMRVITTLGDGSEDKKKITLLCTTNSLGKGICGHVVEAEVSETGENVAVKTVVIAHDCGSGEVKLIENEVEYLKTLRHPNIVKLLYHFRTSNESRILEYIVMERMQTTLWELYNVPGNVSQFEQKLYMYQLLRSVAYIHNHGICHRDIKPSNILIDLETCVLKLCDFGSAYDSAVESMHKTFIGSPEYFAPEILIGFKDYTDSVDIWAVGCIFVELLKGQTQLFHRVSGDHQLDQMMNVFGTPTKDQFVGMRPPIQIACLPLKAPKPWSEIVKPYKISGDAVALCTGLLRYSPKSRLSAHKALAHKFFEELRLQEREFLANGNPIPPLFDFERGEFPGDFTDLIPSDPPSSLSSSSSGTWL